MSDALVPSAKCARRGRHGRSVGGGVGHGVGAAGVGAVAAAAAVLRARVVFVLVEHAKHL